ncbi:hypothetical protein [Dyadobacter sandarakinus]|uniref:Uncharacterized protein n=1 Tax=Dyadobacter sandarakinus TaxID=2747268 RepID=A0ABX7I9Y7_9BACT|nr:hypothetical protein [Dyadobacter sandarakinus]QRR01776.1 hypothetical protein HWI92_13080 [Dyadobacter sandarakinus]
MKLKAFINNNDPVQQAAAYRISNILQAWKMAHLITFGGGMLVKNLYLYMLKMRKKVLFTGVKQIVCQTKQ